MTVVSETRSYPTIFFLILLFFLAFMPIKVSAELPDQYYTNSSTGYVAYVYDFASLLSSSEEKSLLDEMKAITEYGNAVFITCEWGKDGPEDAKYTLEQLSMGGSVSSVAFAIDMSSRNLGLWVTGNIADKVSKNKCDSIADNVYRLATGGSYYKCASKVFSQVNTVFSGGNISEPMKVASNICLALLLSLLINYILIKILHGNRKMSAVKQLDAPGNYVIFSDASNFLVHVTKKYSPRSSGSGGHGGGGGGGGGHGGGHGF